MWIVVEVAMADWRKCRTEDGSEIRVNMDNAVLVQPHRRDRGSTASVITFIGGAPSTIIVQDDMEYLTMRQGIERGHDQV
jgi:hypothetical protein